MAYFERDKILSEIPEPVGDKKVLVTGKKRAVFFIILALVAGFAGGFYYHDYKGPAGPVNIPVVNKVLGQPSDVDFNLFWNVWNLLQEKYVDHSTLNTQKMVYGAISGMVGAVGDPYTVFFEPKDTEAFNSDINGVFSGIGVEIGIRNSGLTVIAPIKNTPAERAGLMAGDKIIKIGDKTTEGMDTSEAVSLIRGNRGTSVKLTISRTGQKEPKEYTIIRENIKAPTVTWKMIDNNIAYVQLYVFNKNLDNDFQRVAKEVSKSKADRIVLDLRNNPGGLLDSAINIASYFLGQNLVVTKERFADGSEKSYESANIGTFKNCPLIIVTNQGSASASEILAGAIKDNRHAAIVGEKTFGKGLVQELDSLSGGASVKITIAKWYTPNGTNINTDGIKPDIEVVRTEADINAGKDPQLDKAVELIKTLR